MPVEAIMGIVLAAYSGECCPFCGIEFVSFDDLKDAVYCPSAKGRLAHRTCFEIQFVQPD